MPTADCGHTYEPSGCATGYARADDGRTVCYPCADVAQALGVAWDAHWFAYLSDDARHVTTWTGGILGTVTTHTVRSVGFGVRPRRHYLRVTMLDGSRWHGTSPGPGMYARLHRNAR